MGMYGWQVGLLRAKDWFHSSGITSLGRDNFSKLLNILLIMLSEARSVSARGKTSLRADLHPFIAETDSFNSQCEYKKNFVIC